MEREKITLQVHGCDDSTYITMEITPEQRAFLEIVAEEVTAAGGGCKPTMQVVEGYDETT